MTSSGLGDMKGPVAIFVLSSSCLETGDGDGDGDADADVGGVSKVGVEVGVPPRPGSSAARTGFPLRKGTIRNSNLGNC
jgi:hypothetical protein